MQSNIARRSNVHLTGDLKPFVRGRPALIALLRRLAGSPDSEGARMLLSPRQRAELAQQKRCDRCGAIPEGPVRRDGQIVLELRCPLERCVADPRTGTRVKLSLQLLELGLERFGGDPSLLVQRLLNSQPVDASAGMPTDNIGYFPVRLTPSQYFLYRHYSLDEFSAVVNTALVKSLARHG